MIYTNYQVSGAIKLCYITLPSTMNLFSPKDIVDSGLCIGCGICVAQSGSNQTHASMRFDAYGHLKPKGNTKWYKQKSEDFSAVCPFSPVAENEDDLAVKLFPDVPVSNVSVGRHNANFVGHVTADDLRMQGSSGGMVTWVATELMRQGLVDGVAHVIASEQPHSDGRYFHYRISKSEEELRKGAKSCYYPVELSEVLTTIAQTPGRYAIIAIPCMIKAIHLLRNKESLYRERIQYTLGLFCSHMKSARFVESFAWQMKVPVQEIQQVEFRKKSPAHAANWYRAKLSLTDGTTMDQDWWHLADGDWSAGFFMNSACNFCDDVVAETADISFGDAWVEPYVSDWKGTNVAVVRTYFMKHLLLEGINKGQLKLQEVNARFVAQTQAAGLRQRREGLAYRLTWATHGVKPFKRVRPDSNKPAKVRKIIYRMRYYIGKWSHRLFWFSHKTGMTFAYIFWARCVASIYYGMTYHKGSVVEMVKRFRGLNTHL